MLALSSLTACVHSQPTAQTADGALVLLMARSSGPNLFLDTDPDGPSIGLVAEDVQLTVRGPAERGRVPVIIRGPLLAKGYVPTELLSLRTQRHGRIRGTPAYLGAGDPVTWVGPGEERGRVTVAATPVLSDGSRLGPFTGTYPESGVAAKPAPEDAETAPPGEPHTVPAGVRVVLYDAPQAGPETAQIPPQAHPYLARVLSKRGGFHAVRIGDGPYVVGYTDAELIPGEPPLPAEAPDQHAAPASVPGVPARLANEPGQLFEVKAGTKVYFEHLVIARFKESGFARVLRAYDNGYSDVLAAVGDELAVRGLVKTSELFPLAR